MKSIFYLRNKAGVHGYLKFVDTDLIDIEGEKTLCNGEEIHFRTSLKFHETINRAFGNKPDFNGLPMRLFIKKRKRDLNLFVQAEIANDSEVDVECLWQEIKTHATDIDKRENLKQEYEVNCHTLVFEAVELTGTSAPRDNYHEYVTAKQKTELTPA